MWISLCLDPLKIRGRRKKKGTANNSKISQVRGVIEGPVVVLLTVCEFEQAV